MTAALFHDIGYPWQLINSMSSGIKEGDARGGLMAGSEGVFDTIKDRLLIYPFYAYSDINRKHSSSTWDSTVIRLIDEAMRSTHGFPGALGYLYLNDRTRLFQSKLTQNDALFRFVTEWSAVAIMMHDMGKMAKNHPRFRFSFETDPLSALIAMADVIEEFNRPKGSFDSSAFNDDERRPSSVLLSYESPGIGVCVDASTSDMTLEYFYDCEETAKINRNFRIDEINEYFNGEDRFIDLRCLGINKVICSTKQG